MTDKTNQKALNFADLVKEDEAAALAAQNRAALIDIAQLPTLKKCVEIASTNPPAKAAELIEAQLPNLRGDAQSVANGLVNQLRHWDQWSTHTIARISATAAQLGY